MRCLERFNPVNIWVNRLASSITPSIKKQNASVNPKIAASVAKFSLLAALFTAPICSAGAQTTPVDFFNPYIGNISHLLVPTYPTIHLQTAYCASYRTGATLHRLGSLPLLSTSHRGQSAFSPKPYEGELSGQRQSMRYSYDQEQIKPYLYSVTLSDYGTENYDIDVRFAPSTKAGIYHFDYRNAAPHSFTFSSGDGEIKLEGAAISGTQRYFPRVWG